MIIKDEEFGEVVVRRNALAKRASFHIGPTGKLCMTVPTRTSDSAAKRALNRSRKNIRENLKVSDPKTQKARDEKARLLAKKAKEYLPYRLEYLAKLHGYKYDKCVLKHAYTRWGSCTHRHKPDKKKEEITISLNIGLMNLPEALRDYVIIHELSHINHPDHSKAFWAEVASHDSNYKSHNKKLKMFSPGV